MNKQQIFLNRQKSLSLLRSSSRYGTQIGRAKCWKGVRRGHWITMCEIVYILVNDYEYDVYTECEFENGSRADIFYIDSIGNAGVVEVLDSESETKFNVKLGTYPVPIVKVTVKDFNIEEFEI